MQALRGTILFMSTITVRNVSPELRVALKEKAKRSGRSLQQIALEALVEKAERLTPGEWLAQVDRNVARFGIEIEPDEIVRAIHEERGDPYP